METLFQEAQERVVVVSELSSLAARIICAYWNRYTAEQLDSISYDMKLLKQIIEDVSVIKQGSAIRKVLSFYQTPFPADAARLRVVADASKVLR